MSSIPLFILKKGLRALKKQALEKKAHLEATLAKKESLSEGDKQWLGQKAWLLGEQAAVVKVLEERRGRENALQGLDNKTLDIVKDLQEAAGGYVPVITGNKRKRTGQALKKENFENATLALKVEILNHLQGDTKGNRQKTVQHFKEQHPRLRIGEKTVRRWKSRGQEIREKYDNAVNPLRKHATQVQHATTDKVTIEQCRIHGILESGGYSQKDIFNVDEGGFIYESSPDYNIPGKRGPNRTGEPYLTFLFAVNADGTEKVPLVIIDKEPEAECPKTDLRPGYHYWSSKTASLTANIYQRWLRQWDDELQVQRRKVIILQDNDRAHIVPAGLKNIAAVNFEPNFTSHVQPLDQGVIQCFRAQYQKLYLDRAARLRKNRCNPSKIDQPEAMQMAESAWGSIKSTTIRNCWEKAGVLPPSANNTQAQANTALPIDIDPVPQAEKGLKSSLGISEVSDALPRTNRPSFEGFLSPRDETCARKLTIGQHPFNVVAQGEARGRVARQLASGSATVLGASQACPASQRPARKRRRYQN